MDYNYGYEKDGGCRWNTFCVLGSSKDELRELENNAHFQNVYLSFDQPQLTRPPVYLPSTETTITTSSHTRSLTWYKNDHSVSRRSKGTSISTLKRPFTAKSRPSISAPTNFRRVTEPMPARRRSFRPLELSIYVESTGRLSPLPDFGSDAWEDTLPRLSKPPTALLRRETVDNSDLVLHDDAMPDLPLPFEIGTDRRRIMSEPVLCPENGPGPMIQDDIVETDVSTSDLGVVDEDRTPTLTAAQMDSMVPLIARPWSQSNSGYAVTAARSQSPLNRHVRSVSGSRSSKGSFHRSKNDTVEEAIRELNTIVEEKRIRAKLSASSPPLSPTSHVPAIAPSMKLRARSETLSDIGSAFSTSVNKALPTGSSPNLASSTSFGRSRSPLPAPRLTIPEAFSSSADSSATALPQIAASTASGINVSVKPTTTRKERLSSWLRRSVSMSPASDISVEAMPQNFYNLGSRDIQHYSQHTRSSASLSTISTARSSASVASSSYATPATTIAPAFSPTDDMSRPSMSSRPSLSSRPSISKAPQSLRRRPKRGLSIDTMLSNGSALTTVPPAYQEHDPHPSLNSHGLITPSRIGVAC